jgi:hypothetical protein
VTQVPQGNISTVSQARTGPMPTGGRWGWYRDHEGNEFRRVSTLVKKVETDTYNLDLWKQRQVAEGLAIRDDLVLAVKAMGRPDLAAGGWTWADKKKLNGIVKDAMQAAKQRDGAKAGTAFHDLTERVDRGEPVDSVVRGLPADADKTIRAYAFLRRENGWRNVEVERTVVCDELEVAGTFDRVDLIPGLAALLGPGECQYGHAARGEMHFEATLGHDEMSELPVIDDVKTEESPWLNGLHIAPQLAIYSRARKMWRPTGGTHVLLGADGKPKLDGDGREQQAPNGEYVPAPCVRQDVAVVVHLRDGQAEPFFVNLAEGWEAARAAYEQMNRESRAKRELGKAGAWFVALPNVKRPQQAELFVQSMAAKDPGVVRHSPPGGAPATGCNNCAPLLGGASMTRVDGTDESQVPCAGCGSTGGNPNARPVAGEVAVRRPDGMVEWQPGGASSPEPPLGNFGDAMPTSAAATQSGQLDEVDRSAIEAVWAARTVAGEGQSLAEVYRIYVEIVGRRWGGRVAEAAAARQRQIECGQRALHHGSGKCACGWAAGFPA